MRGVYSMFSFLTQLFAEQRLVRSSQEKKLSQGKDILRHFRNCMLTFPSPWRLLSKVSNENWHILLQLEVSTLAFIIMKCISVLIICFLLPFGQVDNIVNANCKLWNISRKSVLTQIHGWVWAKSACFCSYFQQVNLWFANMYKKSVIATGWWPAG